MKTPTLLETQRWMKRLVESPRALEAEKLVRSCANMAVYTDAYQARTAEALGDTFETVRAVLGCEKFFELNAGFLKKIPPAEYNLNYYGRELPQFLKKQPALSEVARLEWEIYDSFHTRDAEPVFFDKFSGLAADQWEKLRLKFQPSFKLLALKWPVLKLWRSRGKGNAAVKKAIPKKAAAQKLAVYRLDYTVFPDELEPLEFEVLSRLKAGKSLGQVCGELAKRRGVGALPLSEWFSKWAGWGIFAGYAFKQ